MKDFIPRTAAIHDITGFGRCSLSVIIPVLSSMGVQVCPMPTAILSSHPAGFKNYFFHDLTNKLEDYMDSWKNEDIHFDCIYSGFLGSAKQIDLAKKFIEEFKKDDAQLVVIDPVMADHGKLYAIFDGEIINKMRSFIKEANVITPNFTEACFLLDEDYSEEPVDTHKMKHFLKKLSNMGPENVIVTSVKIVDGGQANIGYSKRHDLYWKTAYEFVPAHYPGTGDIFASALTGYLLGGCDLPQAMDKATRFVSSAVHKTYKARTPVREGVLLESMLSKLNEENNLDRSEIINE